VISLPPPAPPDPAARMSDLAESIADAFEWMAGHFGPPPLNTLLVSPIPASFGQGFPGLLYLSTLSYLRDEERPESMRNTMNRAFFSEILAAHETAHQWWGNIVTSATYHDDWMLEALANYSALLVLEKKKGARALADVLAEYSRNLRRPREEGKTVESLGPITWGIRLHAWPESWRTIVYEKGSWIFHLLRQRMGDEAFPRFLGEIRRRYEHHPISTDEMRLLAAEFLPKDDPDSKLEVFFDTWVYSTGLPVYSLSTSVKGKVPNLQTIVTVKQTDAPADFSMDLPLEIRAVGKKPQTHWIRSSSDPVTVTLPGRPTVKLPALP
jgi:aminopeptidase N